MTTEALVHAPQTVRSSPKKLLPPGIYPDMPFSEYVMIDAVNHSSLRHMSRSPAHFKAAYDSPGSGDTPSKAFGTAAHSLILEPGRFAKEALRGPVNPKTQKTYGRDTNAWRDFVQANPGRLVLEDEEMARLAGLAAAWAKHPKASMLMAPGGQSEVVIVWREGSALCKMRVDRLFPTVGAFDLKSTECAEPSAMARSLVKYHYHTQAAFYVRGLRAANLPASITFVAVESDVPHGITFFEVGEETIKAADGLVHGWLHKLARCQASNEWPSYPDDVVQLEAPNWWLKAFADGFIDD